MLPSLHRTSEICLFYLPLQYCIGVTGSSHGSLDIQGWVIAKEASAGSGSLTLQNSQHIFVSVRCRNSILLNQVTTSKPIIVAERAPNVTLAEFEVMVISSTGYLPRDLCTEYTTKLHCFFNGITDVVGKLKGFWTLNSLVFSCFSGRIQNTQSNSVSLDLLYLLHLIQCIYLGYLWSFSGINYYQVKLTSGGADIIPWTVVAKQTDITFDGLSLTSGSEYEFVVKAMSLSGLESEEASTILTVADAEPDDAG